jgi:hypothetical protein
MQETKQQEQSFISTSLRFPKAFLSPFQVMSLLQKSFLHSLLLDTCKISCLAIPGSRQFPWKAEGGELRRDAGNGFAEQDKVEFTSLKGKNCLLIFVSFFFLCNKTVFGERETSHSLLLSLSLQSKTLFLSLMSL